MLGLGSKKKSVMSCLTESTSIHILVVCKFFSQDRTHVFHSGQGVQYGHHLQQFLILLVTLPTFNQNPVVQLVGGRSEER